MKEKNRFLLTLAVSVFFIKSVYKIMKSEVKLVFLMVEDIYKRHKILNQKAEVLTKPTNG